MLSHTAFPKAKSSRVPLAACQPVLGRPLPRRANRRLAATFRVALLAVLLIQSGCATTPYQIGNQSLFPQDVHTVYVPIFDSDSYRRNLGERMTEAVAKEIENTTPYKVVSRSDADSILTGRIVGETKRIVAENRYDDPRKLEVDLQIEVSWIDRNGGILYDGCVPLPPELTSVRGTATLVPEYGQSVATAHQQAIQRVARQIVGMMEAPW